LTHHAKRHNQTDRRGFKYLVVLAAILVFTGWLLNTPPGVLGKLDAIAYAVCHRIAARSFEIGSTALPLCARCTGMYMGAVAGLIFQSIRAAKAARRRAGASLRSCWFSCSPLE